LQQGITGMHSQFIEMAGPYALLIVFAVVLIGQIGVPIPAIVVLIGAGALAADGSLSAVGSFAIAMLACVIADACLFIVGRHYGNRALQALYRLSLSSDSHVGDQFEHWGPRSLVIAKFVPGLSTLAPPLAGALGVSWLRFVILSGAGSAIWVAAGLGAGIIFAEQIPYLLEHIERIGRLAAVAGISLGAGYLMYRHFTRRTTLARKKGARAADRARRPAIGGALPGVTRSNGRG
jgi:membrane protein DedA with SNARE-associated domain